MERKFKGTARGIGKVVITGPESTGKTNLAMYLANIFRGKYIPEYAREYISNLSLPYVYNDVLHIANRQLKQYEDVNKCPGKFVFFDTWLIITKIWFREVYHFVPAWIDVKLNECEIDYYILCAPDIPWEEDSVRENGGEKRDYLFREYEKEIIKLGIDYGVVRGTGKERLELAEYLIKTQFNLL